MVRVTLLYALALLCAVFLADTGLVPAFLQHIRHLPFLDKVIHFSLFGILALCANTTLALKSPWPMARAILVGSIFCAILATTDELSNLLVAHRTWSPGDLTANYLGIVCLGLVPVVAWQGARQRRLYRAAIETRQLHNRQRMFRSRNQLSADVDFSPPELRLTLSVAEDTSDCKPWSRKALVTASSEPC